MEEYLVYLRVNESGCITAVNSSAFLTDFTGWREIDRGIGDKYHHAQGNYLPGPLMTQGGAYRYKLVNSAPVECTPEEIAGQGTENASPGWQDRIEAQLLFTALMTDTLLEV